MCFNLKEMPVGKQKLDGHLNKQDNNADAQAAKGMPAG